MRKSSIIVLVLLLALVLCACGGSGDAPETTIPAETQTGETAPASLEDMQMSAPQPGYYLISSVGEDGDISFYGSLDPANGYLKLEEDFTGVMYFGGVEQALTWDQESITWGETVLPCAYVSYYEPELEGTDSMLVVYFLEDKISVIFRPAEEPVTA